MIADKYGIYIHLPFCVSRCIYCAFYSQTSLSLASRYVDALIREWQLRRGLWSGTPATLYIGGGTPSAVPTEHIERLLSRIYYNVGVPEEVTIECNPDDVTTEWAGQLASWHVNRVSMGIQTFDDRRLRLLRRRHDGRQAIEAVDVLRRAGISNLSGDLIFGFPGQTEAEWESDIRQMLALGVEHVSAYSLMYDEGTPLWQMLREGRIKEVDEELSRRMYDRLCQMLGESGYEHYEISNFALPGRHSRHNSSYWHDVPYIGLGASAHSYRRGRREWNVSDIHQYMESIERGELPMEGEDIDAATHYNDLVTTALRTSDGLSLSEVEADCGRQYSDYAIRQSKKHLTQQTLRMEGDRIKLTHDGIHVSDAVMSDMMWV